MSPALFFLNEDARILEQIRTGDERGLVTLYQTNEQPVTAYILRNNGTQDDAKDMLQDALVVLWERVRAGQYRHEAKIGTFIYATVRNMWLRRLARAKREVPASEENDVPGDEPSALELMIESEEAIQIASALNTLGDPCRKLLLLFYWEELAMDKIAAQMGFANADTVKSKKYLCKKALEKLLKEYQ